MILQPREETRCGYVWDELEVKPSNELNAGDGVFARVNLKAGTMIPILGKKINRVINPSHVWIYRGRKAIDGHPSINPYKGVGSRGLAIAMMINESTKKPFNCIFKLDHVVIAKSIKAGDELYIDYGPYYNRVGYDLSENRHRDKEYSQLIGKRYPTAKTRQDNINKWNDLIESCNRPKPNFKDSKPKIISIPTVIDLTRD